jgi:hypothetical protein
MLKKGFLGLVLVLIAVQAYAVRDTLNEGETKTYSVGGDDFQVTVTAITDTGTMYVKFNINGEATLSMRENDTYLISEIQLRVNDIISNEAGDVTQDLVDFSLLDEYCGDDECNGDEDCGSCEDCGCDNGFQCEVDECVEDLDCGDGYCGTNEDCEEDECCGGEEVDINADHDNCGGCDIQCDDDMRCIDGNCETYCGNKICEVGETCSTCGDCACEPGYECVQENCIEIPPDECSKDSDCDDERYCTEDICTGSPLKCSFNTVEGCESSDSCAPKGASGIKQDEEVYCDGTEWSLKKANEEGCNFDYECRTDSCVIGLCEEKPKILLAEPAPKEKNLIHAIWDRLKELFRMA